MNYNYALEELPQIAKKILTKANAKTFLFYAEMGMGKTTLIKELAKQLGVTDLTSSPTFSLVNEYLSENGERIYHFDFYRIESEEEAYDIGLEEYFDDTSWCFIEWPSSIENLVPLKSVKIFIERNNDNTRKIRIDNA
jgi:tRNA threonylcarbamoyladenosine biosynthesis protein TsaE